MLPPVRTFCFSTSQLKNQIDARTKSTVFEDRLTAEGCLLEVNVPRIQLMLHRKRFLGYANLQCTYARRKFLLCQTNNVHVSKHSLLFTPVLAVGINISLLMLHGLVAMLALLLGMKLQESPITY